MDRLISDFDPIGGPQVPSGQTVADGHRHRKRDSMFLAASLTIEGEAQMTQVRVRNLSEGGVMAEVATAVAQGTPVEIELRGLGRVKGEVAWSTAGRIGIAFHKPVDPKRARKPIGRATSS